MTTSGVFGTAAPTTRHEQPRRCSPTTYCAPENYHSPLTPRQARRGPAIIARGADVSTARPQRARSPLHIGVHAPGRSWCAHIGALRVGLATVPACVRLVATMRGSKCGFLRHRGRDDVSRWRRRPLRLASMWGAGISAVCLLAAWGHCESGMHSSASIGEVRTLPRNAPGDARSKACALLRKQPAVGLVLLNRRMIWLEKLVLQRATRGVMFAS